MNVIVSMIFSRIKDIGKGPLKVKGISSDAGHLEVSKTPWIFYYTSFVCRGFRWDLCWTNEVAPADMIINL